MEKLKSELDEAEELVIKQKREINDLKNAKEGVESEVSRYKKTKTRLQNEINNLNAIFDQEKRDLSELEAKIRKQAKVCLIFKLNVKNITKITARKVSLFVVSMFHISPQSD